ncbi:hypothetical protein Gorai_013189 [Gossypium raimondii]|uniref:Uncharacterized protein n=2 Tax=Gossypium raimondii TaxID=29730 RepID=A0A0D2TYL5_GOSRA|nr:hypothetical protein B456_009G326100 [Gossypium raimondii]MBA0596367.1 hypothetical protein [Gossypium raimondii]
MICSTASSLPIYFDERTSITSTKILKTSSSSSSSPCYLPLNCSVLHKSFVPLAASVTILLSPIPAKAGLLSGFPGIESIPGPQLPEIEFLNRFNEENQKKYAEADARFKSSPLLKQLLERSKQNKEKLLQIIAKLQEQARNSRQVLHARGGVGSRGLFSGGNVAGRQRKLHCNVEGKGWNQMKWSFQFAWI